MTPIRLFCACLLLAGCDTADTQLAPGTVVVALETAPLALDPRYATDETSSLVCELLHRGLTRTDEHGNTVLDLAASLDTVDAVRYVFRLQPGLSFHDGTPVTARDVRATYASVLDRRAASPKRESLAVIERIDVPDDLTVIFTLREPFAPFLDATGLGILPARALEADTATITVGSGPFRLLGFRRDRDVHLAAARTERAGGHRPPELLFKVVPDDTVRALELRRGDIHFVQNAIDPDMIPWLQRDAGVEIVSVPGTTFHYLGMNLRDQHLGRPLVRQAIALAIDRDAIIRHLLEGHATPATGLLAPGHWAFTDDAVTAYPHDPSRARALLDASGFPDPDGPGPRPRFRLLYKGSMLQKRRRFAEVLQEQLAQIGIALDIRSYEWGTLYEDIRRGNFQLYALAWVGISDPDIYYSLFHSSMTPPLGNNRGHYADPEVDRLTEIGRATADRDARRIAYVAVQQRLSETLPIIPLWWTPTVVAKSTRLQGFVPQPNGSLRSLEHAWLE
jgi:peptide/nickel transport system substrate-binding protein